MKLRACSVILCLFFSKLSYGCYISATFPVQLTNSGASFGSVRNTNFGIGMGVSVELNSEKPKINFDLPGSSKYLVTYTGNVSSVAVYSGKEKVFEGKTEESIEISGGKVRVFFI